MVIVYEYLITDRAIAVAEWIINDERMQKQRTTQTMFIIEKQNYKE